MNQGPGQRDGEAFAARLFVDNAGTQLPYRLLLPEPGTPAGSYPLVLMLHGAGERGTDNVAQLGNGIGSLLTDMRASFPCLAVVPQCPQERRWVEVDWSAHSHALPAVPAQPMHAALALLDALGQEPGLQIDPARVYLVGLSMGGYGVWDALCRQPERFAAAVAICGGAPDEAEAGQVAGLCKVPVWAFHGAHDPVVPVDRSRRIIAALRRHCDQPAVRYTEYPDGLHNAWAAALAEPALLPWLFAQHK